MTDIKAQPSSSESLNFLIILFSAILFLIVPDRLTEIASGFIFVIFIFSYWYSKQIKKNIKVRFLVPLVRVNSGSPFQLELILENIGRLPIFSCYIAVETGLLAHPSGVDKYILKLHARERKTLHPDFYASARGSYSVGNITVKCSDLFGLFPFTFVIEAPLKIIVYPPKYLSVVECVKGLPQGSKYTFDTAYQDVTQQRSVRNYLPGDEIRHINWRVSARYNSLYTNEFDNTLQEPCFVILNLTDTDYPLHLRHYIQEKAIRIAASLVKESVRAHQICGFATTGSIQEESSSIYIAPKKGSSQLILDKLACIQVSTKSEGRENDLLIQTCLHSCKTRSHIFYVGPENLEKHEQEIYLRQLFATKKSKFAIETFFCGDDQ